MARVTSKFQVTIPRTIADQYGIEVGDELEFVPAGDVIRVVPAEARVERRSATERLELFDAATARQRQRQRQERRRGKKLERGWTREELYRRGRAR
jgi:AbrB family looped-hinge helix DNA binding protein